MAFPVVGDEFLGPFPSWTNLKTAYRAAGDGIADDTDAFQRGLNDLETARRSPVLFVPAGTYRIALSKGYEFVRQQHRITVNACLDLVRRRTSRPSVPLDDELDHGDDVAAPDVLGDRETAAEILAALRQIGPEQAAAVVLVDVEGFPVAQVAEMLDVPVGTVKSRCARGRARLAALLGHLSPTSADGNPVPPTTVEPANTEPDSRTTEDNS